MVFLKIADTRALELDGKYIVEYDPSRPGAGDYLVHIVVTSDIAEARSFVTVREALAYWRQSYGIREDGELNRPITTFTFELTGAGQYA